MEEITRGDATRARLLDAALQAFASRGYAATSTRDIAAAAGMSPAAVYVHYRTKEELLFALSEVGHQGSLDRVVAAVASSEDPIAQLTALVRAYASYHAESHDIARILNYELVSLIPEHRVVIDRLRAKIDRAVRGVIEAGVASGAFTVSDPRLATALILSTGIDLARWYREDARWSVAEIAQFYADAALRVVGAGVH